MNIIIPMAGMGKRMRPHTLITPKPLLPIAGKPIVKRLVEDILSTVNVKIKTISFIIGPTFGKEVEEMLVAIADSFDAEGVICYQKETLGTAHAILCAKEQLEGPVFIAFADTLFDAKFSIDTEKDAIIWTQKVADPSAYGVVQIDDNGRIIDFVEKPKEFVSDLAIIGVYYFKDGANLRKELEYLVDNNIMEGGEYQITNAMENMRAKGLGFYTDQVDEWLDCGNKEVTVYTNQRILEFKKDVEVLQDPTSEVIDSVIIQPVYIGPGVVIKNSIIGPHVSLEKNTRVTSSIIKNSIVQEETQLENVNLENSMIGTHINYVKQPEDLNLGSYSILG